jgi:hypothetical protein
MNFNRVTQFLIFAFAVSVQGCGLTEQSQKDCFDREMRDLERKARYSYDIQEELKRIQSECWMSNQTFADALLARKQESAPETTSRPRSEPREVYDRCRDLAKYADEAAERLPTLYTIDAPTLSEVRSTLIPGQSCRVRATSDAGIFIFKGQELVGSAGNLQSLAQTYQRLRTNGTCDNRFGGSNCFIQRSAFCAISIDGRLAEGPYRSESAMQSTWQTLVETGLCQGY